MSSKYEVVACTVEEDGLVGDFDVIVKTDITFSEAQQVTIENIGVYSGGVWPQLVGTPRPTPEEVERRKIDIAEQAAEVI